MGHGHRLLAEQAEWDLQGTSIVLGLGWGEEKKGQVTPHLRGLSCALEVKRKSDWLKV